MTYRLYQMQSSGNCWKPRVALHQLGHTLELIDIDIMTGQSRTDEYLAINPNGRVPLLQLPDGRYLAESNAMLAYLAEGTDLMPSDRYDRGVVFQWMFFEQYSHEPYIAVARYWRHLEGKEPPEAVPGQIEERGYAALAVMEQRLTDVPFFAGNTYSIADIALYAYTHVAHEGGFSLEAYPNVRAWLESVAAMPRFVDMDWRP
ncbi:MAG: glutathione S-transferase family protein [Candidatus Phaeomarinobacter sp.]